MRIVELTARHLRIPLRKTIKHASYTRNSNETLVVRCRLEDGTVGWGEGLPRDYVTGETIETAIETFRTADLMGQLSVPLRDLPGAITACDRLVFPSIGEVDRDCLGNTVRCAVELAVLDAACRAEGVPLSRVTSLVPETVGIRQSAEQVYYSGAVTSVHWLKEYLRTYLLRRNRFSRVKVKVGTQGHDDVASLGRIRWMLGPDVDLRIDANEAWTLDEVPERIGALEPFGISSLEQPVPHAEVDGLAAVRSRIETPIMLDESLCSEGDAHRAIERGLCDLFNIRISKCGGYLSSLRIAGIAHRAGLGYQLGCQVGETGILSAAGRHFATSVAGIRYLEGSFDRYLVAEPLVTEDLTFRYRGRGPALTDPGLGVTVDEAAVERVTIAEYPWQAATVVPRASA